MSAVPTSLAEITPDWLTAALQPGLPGIEVSEAEVNRLHDVANYNGLLAQVRPNYAADTVDGPHSIVAKLAPETESMRQLGVSLGVYRREAALYREVGQTTGINMARYLGGAEDAGTGFSALLLEDLSHLRTGDQYQGYAQAEAELAVAQYARLHAAWWDRGELAGMAWLPAWNDPGMVELAVGAYGQIWPACAAVYGDMLTAEAVALGEGLAGRLADMMHAVAAPPFTLLHGDARHENLMFDDGDETAPPHVVDWQLTARGRGVMDIAYYVTQSSAPDVAAANERALVERYHDELTRAGVTGYSLDECWQDYRRFAYYALVYPVITAGFIDPENELQRAAVGMILDRAVNAALRLDGAEFL